MRLTGNETTNWYLTKVFEHAVFLPYFSVCDQLSKPFNIFCRNGFIASFRADLLVLKKIRATFERYMTN